MESRVQDYFKSTARYTTSSITTGMVAPLSKWIYIWMGLHFWITVCSQDKRCRRHSKLLRHCTSESPSFLGTPETISVLAKLLSAEECSLRQLYLTLDVGTLNYIDLVNTQILHTKLLKLNLDPLRCIRGLSELRVVALNPHSSIHFNHIIDEFNAKLREYLDIIEGEMMMPVLDDGPPDAGLWTETVCKGSTLCFEQDMYGFRRRLRDQWGEGAQRSNSPNLETEWTGDWLIVNDLRIIRQAL
jgi:hypothetical protein